MRVHYLQHVSFESPGFILSWLQTHGHAVTATPLFQPDARIPPVEDIDALVIMGGPMGIYDERDHPWLTREKAFLRDCLAADKHILGVCLGAQLLADALGARVHRAPHKEIGWFPVHPMPAVAKGTTMPSWLPSLFRDHPTVFHWHGDQFDIPPGAADCLRTDANSCQAFQWNARVVGLQFHPEVTPALLDDMLTHGAAELAETGPYIQTPGAIRAGAEHIDECNRLMGTVLKTWLGEAGL
ncbi:MAG TPA: type 1 glutamine amidotransferase [Dinghuibacter sp.]|uniref:type 1 glutamine amidotransferase n=1 Tax=Dinghuibacter sp. TaxID=2024697 RepID=UPI002C24FC76|nr:type 1 glutamine amidotransferase [Dinghuibacter sp.]HTJ11647.1 type 1 glutamine amidotransferase [Dinghuibacter sp.]